MCKRANIKISNGLYEYISNYLNFDSVKNFNEMKITQRTDNNTFIVMIIKKYTDINNPIKGLKLILNINYSSSNTYLIHYIEDLYKIIEFKYNDICYGINLVPDIDINDYYYCKINALNANKQDYKYLKSSIFLKQWSIDEDLIESCYSLLCSRFIYEVSGYEDILKNKCLYFGANENIKIEDCINKKFNHTQDIKTNMLSVLFNELNNLNKHTHEYLIENKKNKDFARKMYNDYIDILKESNAM